MIRCLTIAALSVTLATPAFAITKWTVAPDPEAITWSGAEGENAAAFTGHCANFVADIAFDPAALDTSAVKVTIDMASCTTGETKKDQYLPLEGWFNVAGYPKAVFEAKSFRHSGGNKYVADGTLTLKGVAKPVTLPFTLDIAGGKAHVVGETTLRRLDFGVGGGQLASPSIAALDVKVAIDLHAVKQ
ncbi:MAG TPA: YceI family protein [Parvibaculum sp.]